MILRKILPLQRFWREDIRGLEWFTKIDDQLILGGLPSKKKDFEYFEKENVGAVLNLCGEYQHPIQYRENSEYDLLTLPNPDISFPSENSIKSGLEFISKAVSEDKNVLVHCAKGRTRSSIVMAAYLAAKKGYNVHDAINFLRSKRKLVKVSSGYEQRLSSIVNQISV